jgi:hypothetical protein
MTAAVASVRALRQVAAMTRWVGAGRKLTQTGQLTMADARHLVTLLATGDEIDPVIGKQVFRIRSSAEMTLARAGTCHQGPSNAKGTTATSSRRRYACSPA